MKSESIVQQEIMLEAAKHGIILTRNNVGAGKFVNEETGETSFVRFGLFNMSKEQQKKFKSSDLIGIAPVDVETRNGMDERCGVFIAIEVKKEGWKYTGTQREVAQKAFIDFIIAHSGIAGFATSVDDFLKLIGKN